MIHIGCTADYMKELESEIEFIRNSGFTFVQIFYDNSGLMRKDIESQLHIIKNMAFPSIIHALLDINEFEEHVPKLVTILGQLKNKEVIIHPICKSEQITDLTIYKLADKVKDALELFTYSGITLYLENNSKLDPIFSTSREIEIMFEKNPTLEFLLDIAHIDNYVHLKEMIDIKKPKVLHVADRHLEVIHEHLPLGKGNIDFEFVFESILPGFDGKIILEVVNNKEEILDSKFKLDSYIL